MLRILEMPGCKRFCKCELRKIKVVSMLRNTEARYAHEKSLALFALFLNSKNTKSIILRLKSGQYPPYCQDIFKIISEITFTKTNSDGQHAPVLSSIGEFSYDMI